MQITNEKEMESAVFRKNRLSLCQICAANQCKRKEINNKNEIEINSNDLRSDLLIIYLNI